MCSKQVWEITTKSRKKTKQTISLFHEWSCDADVRKHQQPQQRELCSNPYCVSQKILKDQSMATANHKFQRLVFHQAKWKFFDFLDELQKLAKNALGDFAQATIEQFIYVRVPPQLKKSINQAPLQNGTYEQILSHPEKALELNDLEAPDELQVNSVIQIATKPKSEKNQTDLSPMQKSRRLTKLVSSSQTGKKTKPKTTQIVLTTTKTTTVVK